MLRNQVRTLTMTICSICSRTAVNKANQSKWAELETVLMRVMSLHMDVNEMVIKWRVMGLRAHGWPLANDTSHVSKS